MQKGWAKLGANLTKPFVVNREQLAWAAGIFEGEGTIATRRIGKREQDRAIVASIRMTDEDVIKRFHSIVKVGNVQGPSKPKNPKWKPLWTWQTGSFEGSQAVTALLWAWLCSRRRAKIVKLLTEYHQIKSRGINIRDPKTGRYAIQEIICG